MLAFLLVLLAVYKNRVKWGQIHFKHLTINN
jgi:hypothetical protein